MFVFMYDAKVPEDRISQ